VTVEPPVRYEDRGMTNRAKVASECEAPLYKQLEESFIADIVAGRLKPGDVVPSTYTLAEQYGISRVTAVRCYEELKGRGFLTARRGGSTIVNPRLALQSAAGLLQSFEPGETS
jgi:DNA-binding transcriptional regulator YhcF (GntR family)